MIVCALALVLVVLVASLRGGWMRSALWLVLAIGARVASLSLYQAGPTVTYHHYRIEGEPAKLIAILCALALQALFVAWGLRGCWREIGAWLDRNLSEWKRLAIAGAMLVVSAKISQPADRSVGEFVLAITLELVSLANFVLVVRALPSGALARFDAWLDRVLGARAKNEPEPGRFDRFALIVAVASLVLAAVLNVFVYERHPHVPDEVVYLLHARYLAAGHLSLPAPPVPAAFDIDLMMLENGRWYCPVPIGWPLALAVGAFFGVPWLVNPLLGGLTIVALYAFVRELASRRTARIVVVLLAASPWFVFLNMSFMTHSWTLLCAVVAALGVARSRRTGSIAWCVLGGAAIGMVALIRPLDGVVLALALGLWSIGLGGARLKIASIATLVISTAAVAAITLPYNAHLTGNPLLFPITHYVDVVYGPGKNDMGFGPEKGLNWGGLDPWPGHTPFQALVNSQFNGFAIDAELFGWSIGSLFLVWLWMFAGSWSRTDKLMLAFIAAVVLSAGLYWFAGGPDFGARYWYLAIVPLVWLCASGLRALEERLAEPARVRALVCAALLVSWFTWMPWRAVDKYWHYRGMTPTARRLLENRDLSRSLVVVGGNRHPQFASAAMCNSLDLETTKPVFAWWSDQETFEKLLDHYADRDVWYMQPDVFGSGYQLCGPIPASRVHRQSQYTGVRTGYWRLEDSSENSAPCEEVR
jgi:4-amino-4-deoxy-L-arabinose transferase-like glycosyltransferase